MFSYLERILWAGLSTKYETSVASHSCALHHFSTKNTALRSIAEYIFFTTEHCATSYSNTATSIAKITEYSFILKLGAFQIVAI